MSSRKKSGLNIYNLPDFDYRAIDKLYSNVEDKLDKTKLAKIPGFLTDEELKRLNEKREKSNTRSNKQEKKKSTKTRKSRKRRKSTKRRKPRKRRKSTKRRRN